MPSPKEGSPYASGLEHAELVVSQTPSIFADTNEMRWAQEASVAADTDDANEASHKPAGIQFDRHAAQKASNPDVSVRALNSPASLLLFYLGLHCRNHNLLLLLKQCSFGEAACVLAIQCDMACFNFQLFTCSSL